MTNRKPVTKLTLVSAVVALMLCFAMLLGTTYAWFTDSVTSAGNVIKTGKLDIQFQYWDGTAWKDVTGPIFKDAAVATDSTETLWEPNKTQYVYLRLVNAGNLALKYQVSIKPVDPDATNAANAALLPMLEYGIVPDANPTTNQITSADQFTFANPDFAFGTYTRVSAEAVGMDVGAEHYFALGIHLNQNAGNECQEAQVNFDMLVMATQLESEFDSFGNTYDQYATYPDAIVPETVNAFTQAIANAEDGDVIDGSALTEPIKLFNTNIPASITFVNTTFSSSESDWGDGCIRDITSAGDIVFENCTFTGMHTCYNSNGNKIGGNVTFKHCTFDAQAYAVNFGNGTVPNHRVLTLIDCDITGWSSFGSLAFESVVVKDCRFHKSDDYGVLRFYQNATVTNCIFDVDFEGIDSNSSGNTITITGCTTVNGSDFPVTMIHNNAANINTWILNGVDVSDQVTSW